MANYAVRIYDAELKAWLIAEAARRGKGVKTSDLVEAALRCYQTHIVHEGSHAAPRDGAPPPGDPVRGGDAPDRLAPDADAVAREAVVPPVPAVDPGDELDLRGVPAALMDGDAPPAVMRPDYLGIARDEPVQRVKGPDSGPDPLLGF